MPHEDLAALLRAGGPFASIAVDVSTSAMQPASQGDLQRRAVADALAEAGADPAVATTVGAAVAQVPGALDPVGVAAVAGPGGSVQQTTPGDAPAQPVVAVSAAPSLSALLRARERALPVLVVEARAAGGVIQRYSAAGLAPEAPEQVTGEDLAVHEAHAGGIAQSAHAHSAEDALAQNARLLADRVALAARQQGAGLVLVTGDPRSAELLAQNLPDIEGVSVSALGKDTQAAGADAGDAPSAVRIAVDAAVADAQRLLVDRLAASSYRLGALGDDVVTALQGAAVDVLLIGPEGVEGELLALDAEPWIARDEGETLGAGVVGTVPAVDALIRAAVLTSADVRFPGAGVLPDGAAVAAHLRRPSDD